MMDSIMGALGGAKDYVMGAVDSDNKDSLIAEMEELQKDREAVANGPYEDESLRQSDLEAIDSKISDLQKRIDSSGSSISREATAEEKALANKASAAASSAAGLASKAGGSGGGIQAGAFDSSAMLQGAQMSSLKGILSSPASAQKALLQQQNNMNTGGFRL